MPEPTYIWLCFNCDHLNDEQELVGDPCTECGKHMVYPTASSCTVDWVIRRLIIERRLERSRAEEERLRAKYGHHPALRGLRKDPS